VRDEGYFLFLGRINPIKGIQVLADAARRWLAVRRGTAAPVEDLAPAPFDPNRPPDRCC
jgi:ribosomal protein S11